MTMGTPAVYVAPHHQTGGPGGDHASAPTTSPTASTTVDSGAARRARARANPDWSLLGSVGAVRRFVGQLAGHTADGYGGLEELRATVAVLADLEAVIDVMARHLLDAEACSYREVGGALGITMQATAKRYPDAGSRRPGGQPAHLR